MARTIRVRCNGPGKHMNKVDLEKVLKTNVVLRTSGPKNTWAPESGLPERLVLPCNECSAGKVIILRSTLEENL